MKLSQYFLPTLKETPSEAVIASHQLMLRAGLIRKVSSGLYIYLPMGYKVLRKIEQIVREEMDQNGALEFDIPILVPVELWEESGRFNPQKQELMHLKDRNSRTFLLSPTNEESFTALFRGEFQSYKQLPVNFYQIKTKFRDEIRPRFGVMRGKEFVMKDAYSFDMDKESLDVSYKKMRQAYQNIFNRCQIDTVSVKADSGDMGGDASEEFMVRSDVGEEEIVTCECGYVANVETAESYRDLAKKEVQLPDVEKVHTPDVRTIEELSQFFKCDKDQFIKSVLYLVDEKPLMVLIRGDMEINEVKLQNVLKCNEFFLANDQTIQETTGAPTGFAGPYALLSKIRVIADLSLKSMVNAISGANEKDYHYKNLNPGRDFEIEEYYDLNLVRENDLCIICQKKLNLYRGIEVGHIFKLGDKYTQSMNVKVLDQNGKEKTPLMGCYGIGVSRTLAAVIEQHHDDLGIVWPMEVTPFHVLIIPISKKGDRANQLAEEYAQKIEQAGWDVLIDDRKVSPGFKFKDSELIGIPWRITIGDRSLEKNEVELFNRKTSEKSMVAVENLLSTILELLAQ